MGFKAFGLACALIFKSKFPSLFIFLLTLVATETCFFQNNPVLKFSSMDNSVRLIGISFLYSF